MNHTVPILFTAYAGLDIGRDNGEVVDLRYEDKAPFAFTGTRHKVTYDIRPPGQADHEALHQAHTAGTQARPDKLECLIQAREYQAQGHEDVPPWIETSAAAL